MLRSNTDIKQLNVFGYNYLLSAYADDTAFFVQDIASISIIFDIFGIFSSYSGFKLNLSKCEVSGIGVLKGVNTALCGVKNVDLTKDCIKILGFYFSYNAMLSRDKNFLSVIKKIENTIRVWKMRWLSLIGRITIFKTLAISKIVYITSICPFPSCILVELNKIHKDFIWESKKAKVKHSTLISDYKDGGLRDTDISCKIKALQLSWLRRFLTPITTPGKIFPATFFLKSLPVVVFSIPILCLMLQSISRFQPSIKTFLVFYFIMIVTSLY